MKLGLFSRYYHAQTKRGIAVYTRQLTLALSRLITQHDVAAIDYFWGKEGCSRFPEFENRRFKRKVIRIPGRLFQRLNATCRWPQVDTFHGPFDVLHLLHEFSAPVTRHRNLVVTVHGLGPILHPEYFSEDYRLRWQADLDRCIETASRVIAVSDTLAAQLRRYRPRFRQKIHGIPLGVADEFFAQAGEALPHRFPSQLGIDCPYVLYVGAFDAGKNLSTLLRAFSLCTNGAGSEGRHQLVLVGDSRWGGCRDLKEEAIELNIASKTLFLDYIDHDMLPALYRHCSIFVFPSIFEGFGLPVLEAMACGAPCVISDRPALNEIGKGAALFFDPNSAEDLGEKMAHLLANRGTREDLGRRGQHHAKNYTWENTALETIRIYELMLGAALTARGSN